MSIQFGKLMFNFPCLYYIKIELQYENYLISLVFVERATFKLVTAWRIG